MELCELVNNTDPPLYGGYRNQSSSGYPGPSRVMSLVADPEGNP